MEPPALTTHIWTFAHCEVMVFKWDQKPCQTMFNRYDLHRCRFCLEPLDLERPKKVTAAQKIWTFHLSTLIGPPSLALLQVFQFKHRSPWVLQLISSFINSFPPLMLTLFPSRTHSKYGFWRISISIQPLTSRHTHLGFGNSLPRLHFSLYLYRALDRSP